MEYAEVHDDEPAREKEPDSHVMHVVKPVEELYCPDGQERQPEPLE